MHDHIRAKQNVTSRKTPSNGDSLVWSFQGWDQHRVTFMARQSVERDRRKSLVRLGITCWLDFRKKRTQETIWMSIKILPSATEDLYAGRLFYDKQGEGLGEYFFDSLFSDIDSLALFAGIHEKHFEYYRLLSKRFPYAVYYKLDESVIVVWRVLDLRRHPDTIQKALKG